MKRDTYAMGELTLTELAPPGQGQAYAGNALPAERSTRAVLSEARALVKRGWCRVDFAQSRAHRWSPVLPCPIMDPGATHFCGHGAVARVLSDENMTSPAFHRAAGALRDAVGENFMFWQDDQISKGAVLHALDRAIAQC